MVQRGQLSCGAAQGSQEVSASLGKGSEGSLPGGSGPWAGWALSGADLSAVRGTWTSQVRGTARARLLQKARSGLTRSALRGPAVRP